MAAAPWAYLALFRSWQLRWGATPEEAHRDLPGDDLVARYLFEATRAVSIAAPPDRVWPWIVQMGTGRGGFYALDFVAFTLAAAGDGGTRLLCRLRADIGPTAASRLYGLLVEAGDFVMVRRMLAGITNRAERPPAQIVAQPTGGPPASSRDER